MSKPYAYWYTALAVIALIGGILPMILSGNFSLAPAIAAVIVALVAPPIVIWATQRLGYPLGRPARAAAPTWTRGKARA